MFSRLILFGDNIYNVNWTSAQSFAYKFVIEHKQNHAFFFRFACRLYPMVGVSLAKVQQNPNVSEGSVFLVTCYSLISGTSGKVFYKFLIVLNPSVSQKSLYYKFKTVPSRLFVAVKELVQVFILGKLSYLWTNVSTFFQFCLT